MEIKVGSTFTGRKNSYIVMGQFGALGRSFLLKDPAGERKYILKVGGPRFNVEGYTRIKAADETIPGFIEMGRTAEDNTPFRIMAYKEGVSLSEIERIDLKNITTVFSECFRILSLYEQNKLLHGNVKPGNVIYDPAEKMARTYLVDPILFDTTTCGVLANPQGDKMYTPFEEIGGYLGVTRDVFGAGRTILQFFADKRDFIDGLTDAFLDRIRAFSDIAVAAEPAKRFQTVREMRRGFDQGILSKLWSEKD